MTDDRIRLGIVVSHPIQYQVPLYQRLARSAVLKPHVLFLSDHGVGPTLDRGFGIRIQYDVPLTDGYDHSFVANLSPVPSVQTPWGLVNPGILAEVDRRRCDVILLHGYAHVSDWLVGARCVASRVPYMLRGESKLSRDNEMKRWKRTSKRVLVGQLLRRAAACLPIGIENREFYLSYGVRAEHLHFAPYSVDNERFAAGADAARVRRDELLADLGLLRGAPTILFAAKLQEIKKPLDVIEAFARLDCVANLIVVGDGPLRAEVESRVEGISRARFLGFINQSDMPRIYGLSDIYVLPSSKENWGLSVNEAMAAGAVAVVSDQVGCGPDLVAEETGRRFPAGNVTLLTKSLKELCTDRQLLERLSANARAIIAKYSIEQTARGIEEAAVAAVRK
jgi:glycosyltransferase involved in cell wall biosynthesis